MEESEGSVRVCVQVVGSASRNVNITLQLMESTARGMLVELTSMTTGNSFHAMLQ